MVAGRYVATTTKRGGMTKKKLELSLVFPIRTWKIHAGGGSPPLQPRITTYNNSSPYIQSTKSKFDNYSCLQPGTRGAQGTICLVLFTLQLKIGVIAVEVLLSPKLAPRQHCYRSHTGRRSPGAVLAPDYVGPAAQSAEDVRHVAEQPPAFLGLALVVHHAPFRQLFHVLQYVRETETERATSHTV